MEKLIRGFGKFKSDSFALRRELFERLGSGQQPEALFITCSDSRIDPNLLTQTEPGELFVLRNAGNIVAPFASTPNGETATIEYAIDALGIRDIIVCGHSHCGAMQGLLKLEELGSLPSVKAWLNCAEAARQVVRRKYPDATGSDLLNHVIRQNVLVQLDNLRTHPAVAAAVSTGQLTLHGWVYRFETGDIFAFDSAAGDFTPLQGDNAI